MTALERLRLGAWFTLRDFLADRGIDRSAALAYITLLSLVPLLATVAALYRAFFAQDIDRIIEIVTLVLPYEPGTETYATIAATLTEFVGQATAVGYIGSLVFLAIGFRLFLSVETVFNDIWHLRSSRSPAVRVFSFTMVVFWGPVVIGVGSSVLLWMGHQSWAPSQGLILAIGRLAVPLLGLTMVYWLAPHTGVRMSAAFVGGVTATTGLQLLRLVFVWYLQQFPDINLIYGSLTLAVLFLVSLFLFWVLVMLGAEASWVAHNFRALRLDHEGRQRLETDPMLTALAITTECYRRASRQLPPATLDDLEETLGVSHGAAHEAVDRLIGAGLLAATGAERDRLVPAREAGRLSVAEVVDLGWSGAEGRPGLGPGLAAARLGRLLEEGDGARREVLAATTFAELVATADATPRPTDGGSDRGS